MNKIKKLSAVILAVSTMATVFYSCGNNYKTPDVTTAKTTEIAETITEIETFNVEITDKNGNASVSVSEKTVVIPVTKTQTEVKTEKTAEKTTDKKADKTDTTQISSAVTLITSVITTVKTPETTKKAEIKTTKAPVTTVATTKLPVIDDKINENSVGIFMLSKTDPIQTGNQANIVVKGTPGKTYSIEFYESPSSVAKMTELENKKADENGFVSWTFEIRNTCNPGKRKVIIKENNSDNYIETSITVR